MKKILATILILLTCAFGAQAFNVVDAMNGGHITLSGVASSGYSEAKLTVRNTRSYAVDVDFSTCSFVQANTSQRIGLAYEKSTGAYHLRLSAGRTYTLYFSSRCLDRNRPTPTNGVAFSSIRTISSQFNAIINALRGNYSQADVWRLTDDSGTFSQAWKSADPRPVIPPPNQPGVDLSGSVSGQISGNVLYMTAGKIQNLSSTTATGSLRLRMYATRSYYTGGTLSGYAIGTQNLNPLQPRYYYQNVSVNVTYVRPPAGSYYSVMVVEEYTSNGWVIRDYANCGTLRS